MAYNCKFNEMPEVLQHQYRQSEVKGVYINPHTDDITVTLKTGEKQRWECKGPTLPKTGSWRRKN